jgi:hypothetical protein
MANYTYDWGGRSPGAQNPGKYPRTGPAYAQFGEQPGYVYDPYKDIYVPDPKAAQQYYEDAGLRPKKPSTPGLLGTVGAIGGAGLAYGAGQALAENPGGFVSGIKEGVKGLGGMFGTGGAATTGTQAASTAGTSAASTGGAFATSAPSATESALGIGSTAAAPIALDAGGTATIAAGAQVPAGYAAVGTAADGGTLIAPTGEAATGSLAGTLGTAAGIAGAAYGGYQLYNNLSDNKKDPVGGATAGAAVGAGAMTAYGAMYGSYAGPWGTVIGAAVGAVVGLALGFIGGNKDKDQLTRDAIRKNLQKQGVLDKDFKLTLNDGTQFDVGKDGHFVLPNGQKPYNVDFADQRASEVVGELNPAIVAMISGGNKKQVSDMVGYFTNAVLSSSDPQGNLKGIYDKMGGRDVVYGNIVQQYRNGTISAADADAYRAAIDKVYGVKNPNQGKGGAEEGFFNLAPQQQQQPPQQQPQQSPQPASPAQSPQPQQAPAQQPPPQQAQPPPQPVVKKVTSVFGNRGK